MIHPPTKQHPSQEEICLLTLTVNMRPRIPMTHREVSSQLQRRLVSSCEHFGLSSLLLSSSREIPFRCLIQVSLSLDSQNQNEMSHFSFYLALHFVSSSICKQFTQSEKNECDARLVKFKHLIFVVCDAICCLLTEIYFARHLHLL